MKSKEQLLKELVQNEKTGWDDADLNWFNEAYFLKIEHKQLSQAEHDKIIAMMAHDQAVMNRYMDLKKRHKANSRQSARSFFASRIWVTDSLLFFSAMLLLWFNPMSTDSAVEDFNRGDSTTQTVPADQQRLDRFPEYFIAPLPDQAVRVELLLNGLVVWQSEWQQTQRFLVPVLVRGDFLTGTYHWRVVTKKNEVAHKSSFTVQN